MLQCTFLNQVCLNKQPVHHIIEINFMYGARDVFLLAIIDTPFNQCCGNNEAELGNNEAELGNNEAELSNSVSVQSISCQHVSLSSLDVMYTQYHQEFIIVQERVSNASMNAHK